MKSLEMGGLRFGGGQPVVCVPLVAATFSDLEEELAAAAGLPAGLYEWRADCFSGPWEPALAMLAQKARRPLLCTLRTKGQGGEAAVSPEAYGRRLEGFLAAGGFQFLDVELAAGREQAARLARAARAKGVGVVISHHDFGGTPGREEMLELLCCMKKLGADLPKLAVMPKKSRDVLELLAVTLEAAERWGPVITMSMGALGKVSRVCGGLTGSCVTFAAGVRPSAPGQLPAATLYGILEALGEGMDSAGFE
ncbi:type I 3-dehydroquinate dehydratase [Acutalibacter caecimuris]|uniref:type I 3-dehydroquinate dehydratase n=1 Tax=Acutalibacter caecimuris TaxID=3093657 RepID=UPI002AC9588D|nr:type I 3-dehydroquinate dehydratase [Acutalibacter sp. M00118]